MSLFEDDPIYFDPTTNRWRNQSNGNRFTANPNGPSATGSSPKAPTSAPPNGAHIPSWLQSYSKALQQDGSVLVRSLRAMAHGTASIAFKSAALGIGAFTVGLVGATSALRNITTEAAALSRSMASLRANQGLSASQSFGLTSRNALFGISPQQTAQMYGGAGMNPLIAGIRGAVTGFGNPYSANYLPQAAERYQSMASQGPMGRMMANRMLDASQEGGRASDELRQTLNLRPQQIQAQLDYGQRVQSSMGISPEMLARYSAEIPLASQRVAFAVNMAKVKLATELAPAIESGVGTVASLLAQNAGKISNALERSVHFLIHDAPPMLLRGGAAILHGGAHLLDGMGTVAMGLAGNVKPILTVFDAIIDGAKSFATVLGGIAAFVIQGVGTIWKAIEKTGAPDLARKIGEKIRNNDGKTPEDDLANKIVGAAALKYVALPAAGAAAGALAVRALGGGGAPTTAARAVAQAGWAGRAGSALGTAYGYVRGGGLLAGAARTPVGIVAAAGAALGTAAGYGLYRAGQSVGVFDRTQSFGDRMATGWGRARDLLTLNPGHYERTVQARWAQSAKEAEAVRLERAKSIASMASNPLLAFGYQEGRNPFDAFADGRNATARVMGGQSNLAGDPLIVGNLERLFSQTGDKANSGASSLLGLADKAEGTANQWPAVIKALEEIAKRTGSMDNKMQPASRANGDRSAMDLVAAVTALIAQEGHQLQLRMP
jgi:hypothetical protein